MATHYRLIPAAMMCLSFAVSGCEGSLSIRGFSDTATNAEKSSDPDTGLSPAPVKEDQQYGGENAPVDGDTDQAAKDPSTPPSGSPQLPGPGTPSSPAPVTPSPGPDAAPAPAPAPVVVAPDAPGPIAATRGLGSITLNWDAVSGAESYQVYMASSVALSDERLLGTTPTNSFSDTGVQPGNEYFYRIVAVNSAGDSGPSQILASTAVSSPGRPAAAGACTAEESQVTVRWKAPAGSDPLSGYRIYRGTSANVDTTGTALADLSAATLEYVDTSVVNDTVYFYKVVPYNEFGSGASSTEVNACPCLHAGCGCANHKFVDRAAPAGGTGAYAAPYNALGASITGSTAGDTIVILDTLSPARFSLTATLTVSKSLTIRSVCGHHEFSNVEIESTATGTGIALGANINNVTIQGLHLVNFASNQLINTAGSGSNNNLTIHGNWFDKTKGHAISQFNPNFHSNWTITENKLDNITGSLKTGMFLVKINGLTVAHNFLDGIPYAGINADTVTNAFITGNTITRTQVQGIQVAGASSGVTISGNKVYNANLSANTDSGCVRFHNPQALTGTVTISSNHLSNCLNGISIPSGADATGKSISVSNNFIANQAGEGFVHPGAGAVDATNNYWGHQSGPTHTGNPGGQGSTITSDNVIWSPFKVRH